MTLTLIDADAPAKIERANLRAGSWGGGEAVCMMSALVPGAKGSSDCVTAGWPEWLVDLNVSLFDATVGASDEASARFGFALDVARAVAVPRDYDRARDLFLIRRLDDGDCSALKSLHSLTGDFSQQIKAVEAVETVVSLLRRRLNGENVAKEMTAARASAFAAAYAADAAADAAAYAAASAARAAARAAHAAYAAASAAHAAYAAASAAAYAAASAAASAAARADLITALNAA